jgi:hypothetical protein
MKRLIDTETDTTVNLNQAVPSPLERTARCIRNQLAKKRERPLQRTMRMINETILVNRYTDAPLRLVSDVDVKN